MAATKFVQRELFGGSIVADIPDLFIDASDIRPVPSEQEVFVSKVTDISIVVDILERVEPETETDTQVETEAGRSLSGLYEINLIRDLAACRIHFDDVVDQRQDSYGKVFSIEAITGQASTKLSPTVPTYLIKATVSSPFSPAPPRDSPGYLSAQLTLPYTLLLMVVFRLEQQETDLVVTINCPVTQQEDILHERRVWHPNYDAPSGHSQQAHLLPSRSQVVDDAITLIERVVGNLEIKDWGLFSPEN